MESFNVNIYYWLYRLYEQNSIRLYKYNQNPTAALKKPKRQWFLKYFHSRSHYQGKV